MILVHPDKAAAFKIAIEILKEANAIETTTSPSIILFERSVRNKSTTLKQINWRITAIDPQTMISITFMLEAKHEDKGKEIPMHAPKKEIDAAIFPFLIKSNSFIGVTMV